MKKELISITASFLISSLVFYSFYILQKEEIETDSNLERFYALNRLTTAANDLENEIHSATVYTDFFSIIISHNPDIKSDLLEMYSYLTLRQNKNIISVQFAPNAVVQTVYPRENNEAAIGHDLLGDPARIELTQKAIDKKTVVLQGPVLAKQGGHLLFSRKAIFIEENGADTFWGLAIVAVDFDKLIEKYKNNLNDVNYLFALRSNNNQIQKYLYGDVDVFEKNSIIKPIHLPETTWELAIYPKAGWKNEKSVFKYLNNFTYFIFFIIFYLAYLAIKNYLEKLSSLKKDPLTETLNKNAIRDVVNKKTNNQNNNFAFLVIDVNNFKEINDSLGHYIGDCVLIEIASRLNLILRDGDYLSRFGGDEYIVILDNLKKDTPLSRIIQRMTEEISKPMLIEQNTLQVSISIGYAVFPNEANSYNELYQAADKKMYAHKKENKHKY